MVWSLVKHRDNFAFTFMTETELTNEKLVVRRVGRKEQEVKNENRHRIIQSPVEKLCWIRLAAYEHIGVFSL